MATGTTNIAVEIVASFGQFKDSLNEASAATKTFADQVKAHLGALTSPFEKLQNLMLGIAAIAAGGAVFRDIVQSTLDTTSEVTKLQKAFGGTLETANATAASLKLLGIETDSYIGYALRLDRQIRNNNETLQRMGFTARDLDLGQKGLIDKALGKLLEYKEGIDRNIAAQVLFGRNVQEIYPLLLTQLSGVADRAHELHDKLGLTVTADDKARAREYKIAMTELGMAFDGIKKAIGEAVLPYLTRFAQWFTEQAPKLISGMKESVKAIVSFAFDLAGGIANFGVTVMEGLFNLFVIAQYIRTKLGYTSIADAEASIDRMEAGLEKLSQLRDSALSGLDTVKSSVMAGAPVGGSSVGALPGGSKSASGLLNDKSSIAAVMEYYATAIKLSDNYYAMQREHIETDLRLNRISESEKTQLLLAALAARERTQLSMLDDELRIGHLTVNQRQKIEDEKTLLIARAAKERQKIVDDELVRNMQGWESALGTLTSGFDGQLRGLLAHTTTWAQAMKNITADLVLKMISEFAKLAIVKPLASMLASMAPPAELFTSILKAIMASVGQVFAGVSAFLAPILGPAAPAAAAGVAAGVEATAVGMIPAMATGGYVISGGLAMLHANEKIVPADVNQPFQGGGGSGAINIHINAVDAAGVHSLFMGNKRALMTAVKSAMRDSGMSMARA